MNGVIFDLEEAQTQAKLEQDRDRDAWRWLMFSPHGRRIARHLVERASPLGGGALDAQHLAYREGQRSIGAEIIAAVRMYAPEKFADLFDEDADE